MSRQMSLGQNTFLVINECWIKEKEPWEDQNLKLREMRGKITTVRIAPQEPRHGALAWPTHRK